MNGKQLKNSILQWAIQGKLVPPVCRQAGKTLMTNPVPRDKGKECWFTYVIECEDGSFYKGFTDDLLRRYQQHCNGTGADYTKTHKPKQLYYWEMHYSKEAALQREKYLKSGVGREWFKKEVVDKPENFEPASVLLEKIRQEKERLIKEKKIKRDKNASIIYRGEDNSYYEKMLATGEVKCIDEEIPFEIPTSWSWARLGNLIDIKGGKRLPAGHKLTDNKTNHIYIRVSDMQDGTIVSKDLKYITDDVYNQIQNYTIGKDDLYLTIVGSTIGKAGLVPKMFDNMNLTENAVKLTNIPINKYFLLYYVRSEYAQSQFRDNTKQVGQPKLAIFRIASTLVPIPPFAEQTKIVSKIEYTLHFVNHFSNLQEQLQDIDTDIYRDLKKSILQEAIQGKLVPQIAEEGTAKELLEQIRAEKQKLVKEGKLKKSALDSSVIFRGDDNKYYEQIGKTIVCIDEEIPFPVPNNWAWSRLSSMCSIVNGFTPLRSESKFWDCGTINWFTVEDIKNQGEMIYSTKQKITDEATSKDRIVRAGSVLLCCTASVGQCALAKIDLTTNQQFNALTVKDVNRSILTDNYLFWFAKTLKPTLQRLSGKTTFEFVPVKKVGNILIPIPPFKEQQRIVAQIEKLFEQLH